VKSIEDWLNRPGGLARTLREARRSAGMTGNHVAAALGWPQSKVSKLETGKQMPTEEDIDGWVRTCRASTGTAGRLATLLEEAQRLHQEWKQQVRLGQATIQRNYDDLTRRATRVRNAENTFIPGLLQTAQYARSRIVEGIRLHNADPAEVDAATAQRMQRQQVLYDTSKTFEFVITEAVLRLLLCPPATMLAQLDRLLALDGLPHITLGIIPFGVELPTAPQNSFILFDDDLAVVETFVGETMYHGDEAAAYIAAMASLAAEAQYDAQAREIIVNAAAEIRQTT